jgi:hypothetical protein
MAGVSAGRKAICPALVSRRTIERFHSAQFLSSPRATNLVLEGNPCHEESLEIARKAGPDFLVNTVLNRRLELIGVFSGDLEQSHEKAVEMVRRVVAIPVADEYDIVLTHGGYVGINHYQNAKAACNALPIVRENGFVILAACERDEDPIGPSNYRTLVHLLKMQGPDGYLAALLNPAWKFTKDQWEPQMWGKVVEKVGEEGLMYCTTFIPEADQALLPGTPGWDFLPNRIFPKYGEATRAMVQNALIYAFRHPRWEGREPTVAFIKEGPYAIPFLRPPGGNGKWIPQERNGCSGASARRWRRSIRRAWWPPPSVRTPGRSYCRPPARNSRFPGSAWERSTSWEGGRRGGRWGMPRSAPSAGSSRRACLPFPGAREEPRGRCGSSRPPTRCPTSGASPCPARSWRSSKRRGRTTW